MKISQFLRNRLLVIWAFYCPALRCSLRWASTRACRSHATLVSIAAKSLPLQEASERFLLSDLWTSLLRIHLTLLLCLIPTVLSTSTLSLSPCTLLFFFFTSQKPAHAAARWLHGGEYVNNASTQECTSKCVFEHDQPLSPTSHSPDHGVGLLSSFHGSLWNGMVDLLITHTSRVTLYSSLSFKKETKTWGMRQWGQKDSCTCNDLCKKHWFIRDKQTCRISRYKIKTGLLLTASIHHGKKDFFNDWFIVSSNHDMAFHSQMIHRWFSDDVSRHVLVI